MCKSVQQKLGHTNSLVLSKESMYQPSKAKVAFHIVLHILSMHSNSGLSWRRTPVLDSEFFTLQPENFLHLVNFILWPIYVFSWIGKWASFSFLAYVQGNLLRGIEIFFGAAWSVVQGSKKELRKYGLCLHHILILREFQKLTI